MLPLADDFVLPLADDFYVVAHDSVTFECLLSDRLFRLGLAAAVLGELVLHQRINLRAGMLRIINEVPPRDEVAAFFYSHLRAQRNVTSVRGWIRFFAGRSYELVVQRMMRKQLLRATEVRRFFGLSTVVVYAHTSLTPVGAAEGRISHKLGNRLRLEPVDLVLAGLMDATGLYDSVLARGTPPGTHAFLCAQLAALPEGLSDLVEQTRNSVSAVVASGYA